MNNEAMCESQKRFELKVFPIYELKKTFLSFMRVLSTYMHLNSKQ